MDSVNPSDPPRFICWIQGRRVIAVSPHTLVAYAASLGITTFVVWEFDDMAEEVVHLLATSTPERWEFYDGRGEVRFVVGGQLYEWSIAYLAAHEPIEAIAVPLDVWNGLDHHPLYAPLGFATPIRHPSGWTFRWAPDIVARRLAALSQDDREAFLDAVYERMLWWAELAEEGVPREVIDHQLDKRILDQEDRLGWKLINDLLMSALNGG